MAWRKSVIVMAANFKQAEVKMDIIVLLVMIFCSGHYLAITRVGSQFTIIALMICCISILVWYIFHGKLVRVNHKCILVAVLYWMAIVISGISARNFAFPELKQIVLIVCALLIVSHYCWGDFCHKYVKVIRWICIIAVIGHLICKTSIIFRLPQVENYNGTRYYSGIVFSAIFYQFGHVTQRMHGLFWEPGLLASYILIAIIFLEKGKNYYKSLFFFSLCILLSGSGAGMILLPAVLVIKWMENSNICLSPAIRIFSIIVVGAIVLCSPFFELMLKNEWFFDNLFSKLSDTENVSNYTRQNAVIVDMYIAINSLPFGVGIGRYANELNRYASIYSSAGTSTPTMFLAQFGLLGVGLVATLIKGILEIKRESDWLIRFLTLAVFVSIFSKEPHGNLLFFNCLLFYFAEGNLQREEKVNC